jgi:hypothetical protein
VFVCRKEHFVAENQFLILLALAEEIVNLGDVLNTVDKRERRAAKEKRDGLEAKFKEIRDKYIDALLGTQEGHDKAYDIMMNNIEELRKIDMPSWNPAINYLSDNMLPKLQKEASRDPKVRKAIKAVPLVLGGVVLVGYFALRFLSATPINHQIETTEGIQERAAALEKLIRYDDLMDTQVRRGAWLKGIMFWPIEPTEAEIKGASRFASLAYAAQQLSAEQFGCSAIPRANGGGPSKEELKYLSDVAEYLRDPNLKWKRPPVSTVVDAAIFVRKC